MKTPITNHQSPITNHDFRIIHFESIGSTHKYLLNAVKNGEISTSALVYADEQTNGVGSRGNSWIGEKGNLFLSFCVDLKHLPKDLPLQSISIYFAYILKDILANKGSKIWLKWPNDFYIDDKKVGGVITLKSGDKIICSIGLNITVAPKKFGKLDVSIDKDKLIKEFIKKIKKNFSWKQVFSKYKIEFQKAKKFYFHLDNELVSLSDATLNQDGSITVNNNIVFSSR